MNTKENWLIAWSAMRARSESRFTGITYLARTPKKTKPLLILAKKCHKIREKEETEVSYKEQLEIHVRNNGFQKEWTGWKYTWVKIEESEVPF